MRALPYARAWPVPHDVPAVERAERLVLLLLSVAALLVALVMVWLFDPADPSAEK